MSIKHLLTRSSLFGSAALLAVTAATSPAWAQTAPAASDGGDTAQLGEIVVTAQRRTERLQDVPVAVSVASGQSLQRSNVRSVQDFAARQPAFSVQQAPGGDQLFIRGTGSGANSAFEQSVGTFIDGLYRNRARSSRVALFDIDRVEVLKGPQTTFFGANAIAGAMNITTRKPTSRLEANASALYAPTDGEYDVQFGVGGPIASTLGVRVAGRLNGMDGYIHNDRIGGDGPRNRDGQARIVAEWAPTSNLTIDARLDYAKIRDTQSFDAEIVNCPPASGAPGAYCARAIANNGGRPIDGRLDYHSSAANSYSDIDLYEGQVTGRLNLGSATLVSTSGLFQQRFAAQNDLTPFPGTNPLGTNASYGSVGEYFSQVSQELRLESDSAGRLQYMLGGYFEYYRLKAYTMSAAASSIPTIGSNPAVAATGYTATTPLGYLRNADQDSRTLSGFGSLKYKVTDALTVTGSLRYSDVKKTTSDFAIRYGAVPASGALDDFVPGTPAQQAALAGIFRLPSAFSAHERSDSSFLPSASLQYNFTPDIMSYVSYSHGFKAGGFGTNSNVAFKPEEVNSYEAGLKTLLFGRKLQANLALFRSEYTNLQETQFVLLPGAATSISIVTNAAESVTKGVELSLIARPVSRLTVSTDLAYLDSRYEAYSNAPCYAGQTAAMGCAPASAPGGQGQNLAGRTRYYSPKWSGNVTAEYVMPLTQALELQLGGTVYFKSDYLIAPSLNSASIQKGYAKTDLRATLASTDNHWEAGVIVKNVFDKKTQSFFDDVPGNTGTYVVLPDRPRSVAVSLAYRF